MDADLENELRKYWRIIEKETEALLKQDCVKDSRLYDPKFRANFLQAAYDKITETYEKFLKEKEMVRIRFSGLGNDQRSQTIQTTSTDEGNESSDTAFRQQSTAIMSDDLNDTNGFSNGGRSFPDFGDIASVGFGSAQRQQQQQLTPLNLSVSSLFHSDLQFEKELGNCKDVSEIIAFLANDADPDDDTYPTNTVKSEPSELNNNLAEHKGHNTSFDTSQLEMIDLTSDSDATPNGVGHSVIVAPNIQNDSDVSTPNTQTTKRKHVSFMEVKADSVEKPKKVVRSKRACRLDSLSSFENFPRDSDTGNVYQCAICLKDFGRRSKLDFHMKIHEKEFLNQFKCLVCGKGFSVESHWKSHESKCHLIRYQCYLCKRRVGSKMTLIEHISSIHTGVKPFKCSECPKCFVSKRQKAQHKKKNHKKKKQTENAGVNRNVDDAS